MSTLEKISTDELTAAFIAVCLVDQSGGHLEVTADVSCDALVLAWNLYLWMEAGAMVGYEN